jgi:hypothetical protein
LVWSALLLPADDKNKEPADQALFNGKDLTGWKLRPDQADKQSRWTVVAGVRLREGMPGRLDGGAGTGVLLNGGDGQGVDLLTESTHGDCELHVEFLLAKGSNSGIYFHGQYELQIFDSFGKKDGEVEHRDCGGIYKTAAPRKNASKPPGEWQTFDVVFRAPRFGADGKKSADARFVKVHHNGVLIHEDVDVKGPNAGASLGGPEKPRGPLMVQGTQAPVAFRNVRLKPVGAE